MAWANDEDLEHSELALHMPISSLIPHPAAPLRDSLRAMRPIYHVFRSANLLFQSDSVAPQVVLDKLNHLGQLVGGDDGAETPFYLGPHGRPLNPEPSRAAIAEAWHAYLKDRLSPAQRPIEVSERDLAFYKERLAPAATCFVGLGPTVRTLKSAAALDIRHQKASTFSLRPSGVNPLISIPHGGIRGTLETASPLEAKPQMIC